MTTQRVLAAISPALLLAMLGCESRTGGVLRGTATIAIGYRAQPLSPAAPGRAAVQPGITRVTVTVSAVDIKPVIADLPLDGTIVELAVPAGNGRLFTADGYTGATRTHAGATTVARLIADTRTRVTIPLDPVAADLAPPVVLSTSPASGATGVPLGAAITITFSEPMDPATITASTLLVTSAIVDGGVVPVPGSLSYAANVATFRPAAGLQPLTLHTVTVKGGAAGVADLAGNRLAADVTLSFTTAFVDTTHPTLLSTSPANGATGVPLGAAVTVTFSEPMDPATITASTLLVTLAIVDGGVVPVPGSLSYAGNVATFTPAVRLQPLALHIVTVRGGAAGVADRAGNPLAADVTFSFTTVTAPAVEGWQGTALTGAPSARHYHTAVWAAPPVNRMIVWGGGEDPATGGVGGPVNTGGRYDPSSDTWAPTSTTGAPTAALGATAVWCGANTPPLMVVWGGGTNAGGRYDPAGDTWSPTDTASPGLPVARSGHTAVWTGSRMIVWGGYVLVPPFNFPSPLADGGVYDPGADAWEPVVAAGAPTARMGHTAVWAGPPVNGMIVWGGTTAAGPSSDGAILRPGTGWTALSATGAPAARIGHSAVWTGTHMIVWGGQGLTDGAAYDPVADSWSPLPATGAPAAREQSPAVWTGKEMVIWGGFGGFGGTPPTRIYLQDGAAYDPASRTWRTLPAPGAPGKRSEHTAVWTGSEVLVWGGISTATVLDTPWTLLDSGGAYAPP